MKQFVYKAVDGIHWPDTYLGSQLMYSVDFSDWISVENEDQPPTIKWTVPEGLEAINAFEDADQALIILKTLQYGSHTVICDITTSEQSIEQTNRVRMVLKVY